MSKRNTSERPRGEARPAEGDHFIIGIGTSAGGLEALKLFFDYVPDDCAHSFVVVQHLSPDYKSLMADLLSRNTRLPICEAREGQVIQRGHVYLIPPRKNMVITPERKLHLVDKPDRHELNLPIDIFFKSLAEVCGERSVGVVLTGTGSDGSRGIQSIKEAGGLLMVQDPETARFDGMPHSAITTGLVDYVLAIEQMPEELFTYIRHFGSVRLTEGEEEFDSNLLTVILNRIRDLTGVDFSRYKKPTLLRRIARRMSINRCESAAAYVQYLDEVPQEAGILHREFLIGVTRFFRDTAAWAVIEAQVLPQLFKAKKDDGPIKAWSIGCSTGEEAYSLAILLDEFRRANRIEREIKIFATDIERQHIEIASRGVYAASIAEDLDPARLDRYFTSCEEGYRISDHIRSMVIFSTHNALESPPYIRMDLVFCRNLLIYLQPDMQNKLINILHYALNLGGVLFLGSSEALGDYKNMFTEVDRKWRIYRNVQFARLLDMNTLNYPDYKRVSPYRGQPEYRGTRKAQRETRLLEDLSQALLDHNRSAAVYVDTEFDIVQVVGSYKDFLEFPDRQFAFNLLSMVPGGVANTLASAARRADKTGQPVELQDVRLRRGEQTTSFQLMVKPLSDQVGSGYLVLLMEPRPLPPLPQQDGESPDEEASGRIAEVEDELRETRENLQNTIEELATTNEELQTTNEELLSANEELQSTNEELQSLNEELHTVNSEHQQKNEELAEVNADMENLLKSTDIGTIFLDAELCIRKFTPAASRHFNLMDWDVGRPIGHFTSSVGNQQIEEDARHVLQSGEAIEMEIRSSDGNWYYKRLLPFHKESGERDGVVLTLTNIDKIKEAQKELEQSRRHFWHTIDTMPLAIVVMDYSKVYERVRQVVEVVGEDLRGYLKEHPAVLQEMHSLRRPVAVNPRAIQLYQARDYDDLLERFHETGTPEMDRIFRKLVLKIASGGGPFQAVECRIQGLDGCSRHVLLSVILPSDESQYDNVLFNLVDISELKEAREELQQRSDELSRSNRELQQFAYIASHDLQEPLKTITNYVGLLRDRYTDALDAKGKRFMDYTLQATERQRNLILGLLDYSRLRVAPLESESVDMNQVVNLALADLEQQIQTAGAQIEVGRLPRVQGNPVFLRQLMQNLLSNGIKFKREGIPPRIHIECYPKEDFWEFSVEDNGLGIDKKHLEEIFEIFRRLHVKSDSGGTGLGLALCKKIVELHGGKIWVHSTVDQGSCFHFTMTMEASSRHGSTS